MRHPQPQLNDDDNDNLELKTPLYSEYLKLKGCTYHEQFQVSLKSCKLKQGAEEEVPLRLFYEPTNMADENAVVAQVLHDQKWISIGYIKGKKVEKILDALVSRSIKVVKFKKIEYSYIWSISQFKYMPTLVVTKQGKWARDNNTYSYNNTGLTVFSMLDINPLCNFFIFLHERRNVVYMLSLVNKMTMKKKYACFTD